MITAVRFLSHCLSDAVIVLSQFSSFCFVYPTIYLCPGEWTFPILLSSTGNNFDGFDQDNPHRECTLLTWVIFICLRFSVGWQNALIGSIHTFNDFISARINLNNSYILHQIYKISWPLIVVSSASMCFILSMLSFFISERNYLALMQLQVMSRWCFIGLLSPRS
jgi:hypothetical protein